LQSLGTGAKPEKGTAGEPSNLSEGEDGKGWKVRQSKRIHRRFKIIEREKEGAVQLWKGAQDKLLQKKKAGNSQQPGADKGKGTETKAN